MRLLVELILAAALVAFGWQKSFKEWASEAPGIGRYLNPPNKQTTTATPPPKEFTGHIYYTDENGKKYWLDAQGRRHYEP